MNHPLQEPSPTTAPVHPEKEERSTEWVWWLVCSLIVAPLFVFVIPLFTTAYQVANFDRELVTGCTIENVKDVEARLGTYTLLDTSCGQLRDDSAGHWQVGDTHDFNVLRCEPIWCRGGDRI